MLRHNFLRTAVALGHLLRLNFLLLQLAVSVLYYGLKSIWAKPLVLGRYQLNLDWLRGLAVCFFEWLTAIGCIQLPSFLYFFSGCDRLILPILNLLELLTLAEFLLYDGGALLQNFLVAIFKAVNVLFDGDILVCWPILPYCRRLEAALMPLGKNTIFLGRLATVNTLKHALLTIAISNRREVFIS